MDANNNKYLVITIWIATIAFIGAGFVGWGSVSFGSSANSVAKVGDIDISNSKYSFSYNNAYGQKAKEFGGKFDKEKAKEIGLGKTVLRDLVNEALLLNYAKDIGITVSEKEIGKEVVSFPSFKDKNGNFVRSAYDNFLKSRGLTSKDFELILADGMVKSKVLKLLNIKPLKLENKAMREPFNISDKIKYKIIKAGDINIPVDDKSLKSFWENKKDNYLSSRKYKLNILWTKSDNIKLSDKDVESYYKENSFNYVGKNGKILELKDAKKDVEVDLKLSKIKKQAAVDRSKFKKGKVKATESLMLNENNSALTTEAWKEIKVATEGDYLKPKAIKDSYATIHIEAIEKPKVMSFEEAKELVKNDYTKVQRSIKLEELTKNALKNSSTYNIETKGYISLSKFQVLPELTPQDSLIVNRAIFTSSQKSDSININDGVLVYKIIDQKLVDTNVTSDRLKSEIISIKDNEFYSNLLKNLSSKYPTEVYVKDLK